MTHQVAKQRREAEALDLETMVGSGRCLKPLKLGGEMLHMQISEQAFSEAYTEQKQEDTWMIVRKEKKTDKIKNFIKRVISDCKIRCHEYSERIFNVFFSPNLNLEGPYSVRAENKGKGKKGREEKLSAFSYL